MTATLIASAQPPDLPLPTPPDSPSSPPHRFIVTIPPPPSSPPSPSTRPNLFSELFPIHLATLSAQKLNREFSRDDGRDAICFRKIVLMQNLMATLREKWTKFEEDRARALASMGEVARGPTLVSSWVTEELIDEVETVEVEAGPARKPPVPMVGERTASLDRRKEALVEGQLSSWGVEEEDLMDNPWLDAETPNSPHESWRYAPHKENDTDSAVDLASVQDLDLGSGGRDSEWGNVSGRSAAALGCDTTAASATENDATSTSSNESSAISPDLLDHLFDIGWSISL